MDTDSYTVWEMSGCLFCLYRSSDKTVKVWNTSTRQCTHTFKDHSDQVSVFVCLDVSVVCEGLSQKTGLSP